MTLRIATFTVEAMSCVRSRSFSSGFGVRRLAQALTALLTFWTLNVGEASAQEDRADWLDIELGKSIVLEMPRVPSAIAITDATVANSVLLGSSGRKIQIQGTKLGTTDLVVQFGANTPPLIYEVTVHRDLSELIRQIQRIVIENPPRAFPLGTRIVVQGPVADLDTLERITLVARTFDPEFINLMTVQGDHQVQLEVIFAEVSRTHIREAGLQALFGNNGFTTALSPALATLPTSATATAARTVIRPTTTGAYNLVFFTASQIGNIGAILTLLDSYKLGKVMAQPTVVCLSGQQCAFHSGGKVPIPFPAGNGGQNIMIRLQEYGTRLSFVPTVLAGDVIDVRFDVEQSEVDQGVGVNLGGVSVPGFFTRQATGHVRVQAGMTFAVAGLLNERTSFSRTAVPGLGAIPVIGAAFRATRHQRDETEAMIFMTPRLVRPLSAPEIPPVPGAAENNNPTDLGLFFLGLDYRPGSRTAEPTGTVGLLRQ